jgi:hypothetical protein
VERRGQVIRVPITLVNRQREEPTDRGEERQLFMDGTSRVSREAQARFREGLGVQSFGATRLSTDNGIDDNARRQYNVSIDFSDSYRRGHDEVYWRIDVFPSSDHAGFWPGAFR